MTEQKKTGVIASEEAFRDSLRNVVEVSGLLDEYPGPLSDLVGKLRDFLVLADRLGKPVQNVQDLHNIADLAIENDGQLRLLMELVIPKR